VILVTGGAGFIGSNIVRRLVAEGKSVRVLDNFSTGLRENLDSVSEKVEILEGDIRSQPDCERAVAHCEFVLHQAALPSVPRSIADPLTTHDVNATGTLRMLHASVNAGVKRFVYASSSSVYGPVPKLPRAEEDRPHPISPYAVSKLTGEQYCVAFYRSYGLETVALRYFNVFGPGQRWDSAYSAVIPLFASAMMSGESVQVFGDGEQRRDFTYVDNVVSANISALTAQHAPGEVFNVGAGRQTSVNRLVELVAAEMQIDPTVSYAPPRTGDVRDSLARITRASDTLGYEVGVHLEEGVSRTLRWIASERRSSSEAVDEHPRGA
jgi:nucleoside-diphosphate-sugar epimerase